MAFVAARLNSSRLPAKQFRKIGDRPIIDWIIRSLKHCEAIDKIVIATVAHPENIPLQHYAEKNGLECFWYQGDVDHLTTRLRRASEVFEADICILVSCDCPLIFAPGIDFLVSQLDHHPETDYISVTDNDTGEKSALEGIFVAHRKTWQRADDLSDRPELKEHMFPVIFQRPDLFTKKEVTIPLDIYFPPHRFSVDTWADLEFMNQIHRNLSRSNLTFDLPNVLRLLRRDPDLLKINSHVHQRAIIEDIKNVLFIVDANSRVGYGHLMRSLELALQITERLSWPVTFMVDDDHAVKIIEKHGLRTYCGSVHSHFSSSQGDQQKIYQVISSYGVIILDIYWKLNLKPGWRKKISPDTITIVLNRTEPWAFEADQIIIPEVFVPLPQNPDLVGGTDYIIIRREIRAARERVRKKDIDILAYLHKKEDQDRVRHLAETHGLSVIIVETFSDEFPDLLAASRFYISGFGYSFYEALFLGTIPLTMPLSSAHEKAATFFYTQTRMPLLILGQESLEPETWHRISQTPEAVIPIEDGTRRIVEKIAAAARPSEER